MISEEKKFIKKAKESLIDDTLELSEEDVRILIEQSKKFIEIAEKT
ncbi:hypothetical protein H6F39_14440 [Anabaena sp. FACHB-1250]|uniref:Uncharacterized protein n=1 Tax=Dolichospermum planctonicum TaxID=136072 RepID=A0A480A861_9CYAN|nr:MULTISPECIES: hypothetical protein [Nostocales]MBD2142525.1 hypothetical protein [Anabaena sp. FACHB-1250]MBD2267367.1 hypothetical protein [Anabaena sp. FACHB-1391]GCL40702.1 hypothetical protein NIES80_03910 [Dolichospermum planctonicum]